MTTRPDHAAGYTIRGNKSGCAAWFCTIALIALLFGLPLAYVADANAKSAARDAAWRVKYGN